MSSLDRQLPERISTVDEEPSTGHQRFPQPLKRFGSGRRMATVECTYPDGEREVVAGLSRSELQVLGRDLAWRESTGRDQGSRTRLELSYRPRRSIHGEDMTIRAYSLCHLTGGRARATSDLDHPQSGTQRKRVDHGLEPGRKTHSRLHAAGRAATCHHRGGSGAALCSLPATALGLIEAEHRAFALEAGGMTVDVTHRVSAPGAWH